MSDLISNIRGRVGAPFRTLTHISDIIGATPWDRELSGGMSLRDVAAMHGWERLEAGMYWDTTDPTPKVYFESDPEDRAEDIL